MNLIIGLLLGEGDLAAELVGTAMIVLVFIAVVVVRSARARSTVIKAPSFFVGFGARARQRHRQVLERLLDPGETVIATAQAMHNSPGKDFLLGDFAHIGMKTFILGASTRRLFALEELIGGANPIWAVPLREVTVHKFKKGLLGTRMSLEQHGQKLHLKTIFGYGQAAEAIRQAIVRAHEEAEHGSG